MLEHGGQGSSFYYGQAHFTILDNNRSDQMPPAELAFLESDLKAHAAQPLKIVVSHRPSWVIDVAMRPDFPFHRLAKQYGVQYVIAGHLHQILHLELDGVTYISLPSAGGHLRLSGAYGDGCFFGYTLVTTHGNSLEFQVKEITSPRGEGRVTRLGDWAWLVWSRSDLWIESAILTPVCGCTPISTELDTSGLGCIVFSRI